VNHSFSMKVYVPSTGITGNQPNRISLKLQDGTLGSPWTTQCEIIKPLVLNQWQVVTFNFLSDPFLNFDAGSANPTQRNDFNRVLIQVNGENNSDRVIAFIDDFLYDGTIAGDPVYDNLVWADEFDTDGAVNSSLWFHQTQLPAGGSWFNGEIQHYTNRSVNSYVSSGTLKIVAKKESYTSQGVTKQYTSARLNSKFAFKYGKVVFRAKLPSGAGTWPALWTLGKNVNENGAYWDSQGFGTASWPACGEMDIMEHWGNNQNFVQSATHTPSSFGSTVNKGGQVIPTASSEFHDYGLEWSPKKLIFSVDGIVHYTYNPVDKNPDTWPFTAEQYLLMNVAIQDNIFPGFTQVAMEVDYVRIYQQTPAAVSESIKPFEPKAWPNPAIDVFHVELEEVVSGDVAVQIFNAEGKLIRTSVQTINGSSFEIPNLNILPTGLYQISFQTNHHRYSVKMARM
jgi:beta-glucanase (GH16 family)